MSICVPHPHFGCIIWHCALFCQNASGVYTSGLGPWEVSLASSGMLQIVTVHAHTLFGHHHPPLSIWVISLLYGPSAITHLPVFHPTTLLFHQLHQIFEFSHMHTPDLVITTHLGLPSPPTIDWPPIPPTCWPSATFCPTPHRLLSISHPICLSVHLFVCQPTHFSIPIHLAPTPPSISVHLQLCPHPSICPSTKSTWAPCPLLSIHLPVHLSGACPQSIHCHHWVTFMSVKDIVYIF